MPSKEKVSKEGENGTGLVRGSVEGRGRPRPSGRRDRTDQQLPARSAQAEFSNEVNRLSGIDAPCVFTGAALLP